MKSPRALPVLFALVLCCLVAACGPSNTVHLYPIKADGGQVPSPSSVTLTVVRPADERPDPSLGQRSDGSPFMPVEDVQDWVGHAILDAIRAKGYQVNYAATAEEAAAGHAECVITGAVRSVTVKEHNAASYETTISVKYRLARKGKHVATETLTANQKKTLMPSKNALETLLQDTLWDVVSGLADKVAASVR